MDLKLIEPTTDLEKSYIDYISEWEGTGEIYGSLHFRTILMIIF